jgi:myosin heavy subunit
VIYDASDFVRKNADSVPQDLVCLARTSTNPIIREAFPKVEEKEKRRGR